MKRKIVSGMMLTLLLIGMLTLAFNIQTVKANDPALLKVVPSSVFKNVSDTFKVNVTLYNVTNMFSFEYKFKWDATVINCTSYTTLDPKTINWGKPPAVGPPFIFDAIYTYDYPMYIHHFSIVPIYGATPFTGSITLATYTFQVINLGSCVLNLYDTKLGNSTGKAIPHTAEDGYFEFIPLEHDIAVFVNAPAHLIPEDSALLNASVLNVGLNNETDVELELLINGSIVDSVVIDVLQVGSSYTLSYLWTTTTIEATYNVTAYALQVPDEDFTLNNIESARVPVSYVIRVPFHYQTIQEAIDAANPGDTILVSAGTYYEHLTIDKSLTLVGEESSTTIIDGNGADVVIRVTADNVYISKFTIQNAGLGMGIIVDEGIKYTTITGNRITNTYSGGILLGGRSNNNFISDNKVSNNGVYGIALSYSDNNFISDNEVSNNGAGVGIHLWWSGNNFISDNKVSNNLFHGIVLYCSDNNTVSGNWVVLNPWAGILLEWSKYNTVSGNAISNNEIAGIYAYDAENNVIYHNSFINNTHQVFLYHSNNIWDNGCEGNYWSDYTGEDLDGDGIGDTLLPHQGVDYYPLMSPYMEGDVNHDAIIDIFDLVHIGITYGSKPNHPNWNPHADLNEDKIIDIMDILITATHFGERWDWSRLAPRRF